MATHSSVLAWRIPGTGEPGGRPSMGSHRVGHDCRRQKCYEALPYSVWQDVVSFSDTSLPLQGMPSLQWLCPYEGKVPYLTGINSLRRDSTGERSPWLPLETRPDSPGVKLPLTPFHSPSAHSPLSLSLTAALCSGSSLIRGHISQKVLPALLSPILTALLSHVKIMCK